MTAFTVRPTTLDDVSALCALLNEIIRIGGTTAHETPVSEAEFADDFVQGPNAACCFTAVAEDGALLGFQSLEHDDKLPECCGDIGTFARAAPKVPGVGSALFHATKTHASELGLTAINATIRADNTGGLAYYSKMGFVDHAVKKAVPLSDGTPVDRISKRFAVARDT